VTGSVVSDSPTRSDVSAQRPDSLVSIVVLNHNHKDSLRQCISSALELEWPLLEVIVVDNASSDGSSEMVRSEFGGRVRLICRRKNSPTAARNEGFREARGQYILSLDDDIILPDKAAVQKAILIFNHFPKTAALAFKIGTVERPDIPLPEHWWHPVPLKEGAGRFFLTNFFGEAAVFFRAKAMAEAGGYDETFFWGCEGMDLAFKLIDRGYDILFCPNLFCAELRVRGFHGVNRTQVNYLTLRNKLWLAWKYYPLWLALPYALIQIARGAPLSAKYGWFDLYVRALKDGVLAPKAIRCQRKPLGKETWRTVRSIRWKRAQSFVPDLSRLETR
jgi:GT2 family glycosyltransferase